jgi:hypothetical protein
VDVIAVSVEQSITDVFPRPFGPRPWAEELYWVSIGLHPAPIHLQRLVGAPTQVAVSFDIVVAPALLWVHGAKSLLEPLIPALFPTVDPNSADCVNVRCATDLVVTDHARLEKNADWILLTEPRLHGESFQHTLQFVR